MAIDRTTVGELLEAIASRRPTPGGGAVAAAVTSLAAALGAMVTRYTATRAGAGAGSEGLEDAVSTLDRLRGEATALADADAEAFGRLSKLWTLPRAERREHPDWAGAVAAAIDAPRRVIETAMEVLETLEGVQPAVGRNLASDLAISALLALSGAEAAAWNVRINLPLVSDRDEAARLDAETGARLQRAAEIRAAIERYCREK